MKTFVIEEKFVGYADITIEAENGFDYYDFDWEECDYETVEIKEQEIPEQQLTLSGVLV